MALLWIPVELVFSWVEFSAWGDPRSIEADSESIQTLRLQRIPLTLVCSRLKLCKKNWALSLLSPIDWGWKCYWFAQWSRKQDNQIDQRCCNLRISATRHTGKPICSKSSPTVIINTL